MAKTYYFEGITTPEKVKVVLSNDRRIFIASSITKYNLVQMTKEFFGRDRDKRLKFKMMSSRIKNITDQELDAYIKFEFIKVGYRFLREGT